LEKDIPAQFAWYKNTLQKWGIGKK